MIIHTGDSSLQYKLLINCFTQNNYIKQHLIIHTGDKPFKCKVCDEWLTNKHTIDIRNACIIKTTTVIVSCPNTTRR